VRAGAVLHNGKLLERPVDITPPRPGADSTETDLLGAEVVAVQVGSMTLKDGGVVHT
jgi:hypothetical protein